MEEILGTIEEVLVLSIEDTSHTFVIPHPIPINGSKRFSLIGDGFKGIK